ncbi:hypothetical protein FVEN_g12650 [Fusarium venenatum]|nr:hypothetical protein FVEN_g12650 [Fusarium venenatum]
MGNNDDFDIQVFDQLEMDETCVASKFSVTGVGSGGGDQTTYLIDVDIEKFLIL